MWESISNQLVQSTVLSYQSLARFAPSALIICLCRQNQPKVGLFLGKVWANPSLQLSTSLTCPYFWKKSGDFWLISPAHLPFYTEAAHFPSPHLTSLGQPQSVNPPLTASKCFLWMWSSSNQVFSSLSRPKPNVFCDVESIMSAPITVGGRKEVYACIFIEGGRGFVSHVLCQAKGLPRVCTAINE